MHRMNVPLPFIEVKGTHHEVGRQLGEAERALVQAELASCKEQFPLLAGITFSEAIERSGAYLRAAQMFLPRIVDQLRGMAEGALVPFEALFALNCDEEFTCLPEQPSGPGRENASGAPQPGGKTAPEHCTSFAFVSGGRPIAGHNEDWYPGDIESLSVRHVTLAGGVSYLSVGAAGNLPFTGVTSNGLCTCANTLYSFDLADGVPNALLLASLFECRDLDEARERIGTVPRARGSNHLLADAAGRILDVETTAGRLAWLDGGACFVHTNHYVTPELAPQDATTSTGTCKRRARAQQLLAAGLQAGDDPLQLAQAVLRDHENAPLSICAHWNDDDPAIDQSVTTASMVWEPAEGVVHAAVGQPCEHEYVTYRL
jgi:isopenicillin-N N-acyltransferase like protein